MNIENIVRVDWQRCQAFATTGFYKITPKQKAIAHVLMGFNYIRSVTRIVFQEFVFPLAGRRR